MRVLSLAVLFPLLALAACKQPEPPPLSPDEVAVRDSALALLGTIDTERLSAAFERLDAFRYRVVTQTEQLGDAAPTVQRTVTADVTPAADGPRIDIVQTDSSGTFDFGRFDPFANDAAESPLPAENPATLVLPEDPAYLDPRGREAFAFSFAPDTLLGGRRVQIVAIAAREGEDDQALRRARLYIDRTTGVLVGVRLRRRTESVIFREASDTAVLLQPGPADGWLPSLTRVETTLGALFTDQRRFRLTRRYSDFQPAAAASDAPAPPIVAGG